MAKIDIATPIPYKINYKTIQKTKYYIILWGKIHQVDTVVHVYAQNIVDFPFIILIGVKGQICKDSKMDDFDTLMPPSSYPN